MISNGLNAKQNMNIAGIIPAFGFSKQFEFPWPDCMIPIADRYHAIQRSILECSCVGCGTIWIVAKTEEIPLIRKVVGDFVMDISYRISCDKKQETERRIEYNSIMFVPLDIRDKDRKDSMPWAIVHGMTTSYKIGRMLSRWNVPQLYYISFPLGLYDPFVGMRQRTSIRIPSEENRRFFLSYDGKTVRDGLYLGFNLYAHDFFLLRKAFLAKATKGGYTDIHGRYRKFDKEDRYTGRFFELSDIFNILSTDNATIHEVDEYYQIDDWQKYAWEYMNNDSKLKEMFRNYADLWKNYYDSKRLIEIDNNENDIPIWDFEMRDVRRIKRVEEKRRKEAKHWQERQENEVSKTL